jgi:TPR repeat protein
MRRGWKIALGLSAAVILTPVVLLSPPAGELMIRLTCRMEPLTPHCIGRMRAMGHVWAKLGWLDRAIMWYGRAATEGDDTAAYFHLGWAYEQRGYRRIVPKLQAHTKALEAAAAKRQAELKAQVEAGVTDMADLKMPTKPAVPEANLREDFERAEHAYRMAADRGFAPAMNNLGQLYTTGVFGSAKRADGAEWILRAAKAGNPFGAINAALIYTGGIGVSRDAEQAIRWGGWNGELTNPHDVIYPTLEHTTMVLTGAAERPLVLGIREIMKTHEPLNIRFKPLQPDPRLPTFRSISSKLH